MKHQQTVAPPMPSQTSDGAVASVSDAPVQQAIRHVRQYPMPEELGGLYRHPGYRLSQVSRDAALGYIAVAMATAIDVTYEHIAQRPTAAAYRVFAEELMRRHPSMRLCEVTTVVRHSLGRRGCDKVNANIMLRWVKDYWEARRKAVLEARKIYEGQQAHIARLQQKADAEQRRARLIEAGATIQEMEAIPSPVNRTRGDIMRDRLADLSDARARYQATKSQCVVCGRDVAQGFIYCSSECGDAHGEEE